jgi:hydrogenase expression/formation protein HypE
MIINMSHGSGGKETNELIKSVFAKHFKNDVLEKMEDAAILDIRGKIAFTTDSFVVTPLFFKGGDIGRLAICGTVNDLLMQGATPRYLTVGFIIEEGMDTGTLEKIAESMAATAKEANVLIVAGDTKVIEGKGGVYINTSGIGIIEDGINISASNCAASNAIILSGTMGDHHGCILSSRMGIKNNISSDAQPLNSAVFALLNNGIRVKAMRDVTRGGLGTILNELAESSCCGADIYENKIPINMEVKGLCDILGLDPMYMGNEGKFLAIIDKDDEKKAIDILYNIEASKDAAVIGYMREESGVTMITKLGGRRIIDVLYGEGLPRIC